MATCRHCGNEWKPGGKWHDPTCPIVTGVVSTLAILKKRKNAKPTKYQSINPVADESPRVEKLKDFE